MRKTKAQLAAAEAEEARLQQEYRERCLRQPELDAAWAAREHISPPRKLVCAECGAGPLDGVELKRVGGALRCEEHRGEAQFKPQHEDHRVGCRPDRRVK
jgi:hypothetical protein